MNGMLVVLSDAPPSDVPHEWIAVRNAADPEHATTVELIEATKDDPEPLRHVAGRVEAGGEVAIADR